MIQMNKLTKKDYHYLIFLIISFILLIFILFNKTYYFDPISTWITKYIPIPEYFRTLFYNTKDLIPDFAFNLSNGQNIYNYSTYGFLSPIILVSYLLPNISMSSYIIFSTIIFNIISIILIYIFLKKNKIKREVCLISSFIFIILLLISYNSLNNFLFFHSLTFLILSLLGIDKVFEKQKGWLLSISCFFMFTSNITYTLSNLFVLIIYFLYSYLKLLNKGTLKSFFQSFIRFIIPILLALLSSSFLLIPSLATILNKEINNIKDFTIPIITLKNPLIIFSIIIIIISLICNIKKHKSKTFLSTTIILSILINIFTYITEKNLNYSFLILVSLIPLYILGISDLIKELYKKMPKKSLYIIPIFIIIMFYIFTINPKNIIFKNVYLEERTQIKDSLTFITNLDNNFYRITNNIDNNLNIYDEFNYYTSSSNNLLSMILNNNKYLISKDKPLQGYEQITNNNGIYIYKNDNVLPLGYATSNIMNYEEFYNLNYLTKKEALLNVIVTNHPTSSKFISNTKKISLDLNKIFNDKNISINKKNTIKINTKKDLKLTYNLPKKYQNKILHISYKIDKNINIKINNNEPIIENNKYNYILSNQDLTKLVLTIPKGNYSIKDFEIYILDYSSIENCPKKVDKFVVDKSFTKGDYLKGTINVIKDSYFTLSIPYSPNFIINVDNQKVPYEKANEDFIGFKISEGNHIIELEYKSPGKNISIHLSLFGFVVFGIITLLETKRKF